MLSKITVPTHWIQSDAHDVMRELNGLVLKNIIEFSKFDYDAVQLARSAPHDFFDHYRVEITSALMDDSDGVPNDWWLTAATDTESIIELLTQTTGTAVIIGWNCNSL